MKKPAFSLVELLVSVMVISIIAVAFAPIVTKRLKSNLVAVSQKVEQQEEEPEEEQPDQYTQYKLFTIDNCNTSDAEYRIAKKCNFTIPAGVTEINVVTVSAGNNGTGAAYGEKGEYVNSGETAIASTAGGHYGVPLPNESASMHIYYIVGGSGGGGGGMHASSSVLAGYGGGGGATGYLLGGYWISSEYEETLDDGSKVKCYLKGMYLRPGAGGAGGAGNGTKSGYSNGNAYASDGSKGGNSTAEFNYFCYNGQVYNKKFTVDGGNGGSGAKAWADGTGGTNPPSLTVSPRSWIDPGDWVGSGNFSAGQAGNNGIHGEESSIDSINAGGDGGKLLSSESHLNDLPDNQIYGGKGGGFLNWKGNAGQKGSDGYIHINWGHYIATKGAAGSGGLAGGLVHMKKFPVTPGQQCTIQVGKGGTTGYAAHKYSPEPTHGGESFIQCGSNKVISGTTHNNNPCAPAKGTGYYESGPQNGYNICGGTTTFTGAIVNGTEYKTLGENIIKLVISPQETLGGEYVSWGARGGQGGTSPTNGRSADPGSSTNYGGSSITNVNGESLPFTAPSSIAAVESGNYGSAGAGGGGGSWDSYMNVAGAGGAGQNGYVFIYW